MKKGMVFALVMVMAYGCFATWARGENHEFNSPITASIYPSGEAMQSVQSTNPGDNIHVSFYQGTKNLNGIWVPALNAWARTNLHLLKISVAASSGGPYERIDSITPFSRQNVPMPTVSIKPEKNSKSEFYLTEIIKEPGSYTLIYMIEFKAAGKTHWTNRYINFDTQPLLFDGGYGYKKKDGSVVISFYGIGLFGETIIGNVDVRANQLNKSDIPGQKECDDCSLLFQVIYTKAEYVKYLSGRTVDVTFSENGKAVTYSFEFEKYAGM